MRMKLTPLSRSSPVAVLLIDDRLSEGLPRELVPMAREAGASVYFVSARPKYVPRLWD